MSAAVGKFPVRRPRKSAPTAPRDSRLAALRQLIDRGVEPSPENLLIAAEDKAHPLHSFFFDTPDETWIEYGRYEAARHIIQHTKVEFTHGGKTMEVRAVEFVKGTWATTETIAKDPRLRLAYMREIENLMSQAQQKMARMMELMPDE